jgi:uncharacterized protein (TIGR02145 family)
MIEVQIFPVVDLCIDGDDNQYQTVQIGNQIWMGENLKTTKYNDGTAIPTGYSNDDWKDLTTGAYAVLDDDADNIAIYGNLYNGWAVDTGNLAPDGWHIPTFTDWEILYTYLGGGAIAGGKLKETGTTYWQSPNTGATNETGFTGRPGGYRSGVNGIYLTDTRIGYFARSNAPRSGTTFTLHYNEEYIGGSTSSGDFGHSVRCVKSTIGDDLTEASVSSQAMSGVSITIPPSHASSDRWDTFGISWNVSKEYWAIT